MDPMVFPAAARRRRRALATALVLAGAFTAREARAVGGGHVMPWVAPGAPLRMAVTTPHLGYYGGPVISNVEVVMVLWGSGTYQSFVQLTSSPSLATFYGGVTNSPYLDWLTEYDTGITPVVGGVGTNQTIGRGTYLGQYTITPSAANGGAPCPAPSTSTCLDDTQIAAEVVAQIHAGHLPAPVTDGAGNVNTLYMVHFPKGIVITLGGTSSCVSGGFCAYHSTTTNGGQLVYYGVLPDASPGSGCDQGCGAGTAIDNATSTASHELVEAVTDAGVGLAVSNAPPLAWYDPTNNNGEIGDICNAQDASILGGDGVTYAVQRQWSNVAGACIVAPAPANDFSIGAAPTAQQVARGSSTTYAISTAVTSGAAQSVTFSVASLPGGISASFSPASATAGSGSVLTLTAGAGAALQTTAFTVQGTAASGTHNAVASVTVLPVLAVSPSSASLAPRAGRTFTASGGSGAGLAWSLATNASGGSIDGATGAYTAGATGAVSDVVRVIDSVGDVATATVAVTAGVSIGPATATVAPRAGQAFTASGGSGAGYAWSLATNGSGATIDAATGAYRAGATGGVGDVVRVTDSLGNVASAAVTVTAGVSIAPPSATVAAKGTQTFTASGGSGAGWTWSLATNASGGTIDAGSGVYHAGDTGGVSDVVQVVDSLGNAATASVTVPGAAASTTASGSSSKGCGCGAGEGAQASALLVAALALLPRRRRGRRAGAA